MPAEDTDHRQAGAGGALAFGAALTILWCAAVAAYAFLGVGGRDAAAGAAPAALTILVVVLPVAMIWVAVIAAHSVRTLRSDIAQLHAALAELKRTQSSAAAGNSAQPVAASGKTQTAPAATASATGPGAPGGTFATRRDAARTVPSADSRAPHAAPPAATGRAAGRGEQPSLALGTPTDALGDPLDAQDLIRALNFPESAEDREGFRALRRALAHHETARLIRAAQDVLTLLSEEGLYMDDLVPDRARPDVWRRFAQGERGRPVAALGGIHDRDALALAAARMRGDAVFRDAAHHFLRQFDRSFVRFCEDAEDAQIARLTDTRTARAFMLLGRAAGSFD